MEPWVAFLTDQDRQSLGALSLDGASGEETVIDDATALVVVDVVRGFTGTRPLPMAEAVNEFRTSCGARAWQALPHVRGLIDKFRDHERLVVWTRGADRITPFTGRATTLTGSATLQGATDRDTEGNQFLDDLRPRDGEPVIEKTHASAFHGTPLRLLLHRQGVRRVVVCGTTTSGCVRATVVDGYSEGFDMVVVGEACFDRFSLSHAASLFDIHTKYGTVISPGDIS